ncbi:MAG: hypothetical protein GDA43_14150 [Hormoscilla sp. SP5CHS1]|nr:hypothetical protein [Hormoscilla sp. SP5CHS1]
MANSWKHGDRCIAGINPRTGKWVRPTSRLPDGRVPKEMRQINRREPALLDLLEIPLAETGEDFGFESENQDILPGKWRKIGQVTPQEASQYCSQDPEIMQNDRRDVTVDWLQSLPGEMKIHENIGES